MKKHHKTILQVINRFFDTHSWNLSSNLIKSSEDEDFIYFTLLSIDKEQSLDSKKRHELIDFYFKSSKNTYCIPLLQYFYQTEAEYFFRTLKRSREHLYNPKLSSTLKNVLREDDRYFIRDISVLSEWNSKIESDLKALSSILKTIPIEELLFNVSIWLDKVYIDSKIPNIPKVVSIPDAEKAISLVIKTKQKNSSKESFKISHLSQDQNEIGYMMTEKYFQKLSIYSQNDIVYLEFDLLMVLAVKIVWLQQKEEKYCYAENQFLFLENDAFLLIPNCTQGEKSRIRVKELDRYLYHFYHATGVLRTGKIDTPFQVFTDPSIPVRWEFNGFPKDISLKSCNISPDKLLLFLNGLRLFHQQRYMKNLDEAIEESEVYNPFYIIQMAIRKGNIWIKPMMGSLNCTTIDYLVNRVQSKISFDTELNFNEIKEMILFFSYDLNKGVKNNFTLFEYPFLKIENHIFYNTLSILFSNPAVIIENRFFKDWGADKNKLIEVLIDKKNEQSGEIEKISLKKIISDNLELSVEKLFQHYNFKTLRDKKIKRNDGTDLAQIDNIIYQEGFLLIIETKKTYTRRTLIDSENYQDTLKHAGKQLDRIIEYINKNKDKFLKEFNIPISPTNLQVEGLIVSSATDGNFQTYGKGQFPKISLAELTILLGDEKGIMMDGEMDLFLNKRKIQKLREFAISNNFNLEKLPNFKINHDQLFFDYFNEPFLWETQTINLPSLYNAIKNDWLWRDIVPESNQFILSQKSSSNEKEAHLLYLKAKKLCKDKEFEKAIDVIKEAIKLSDNTYKHSLLHAGLLFEIGKVEESINIHNQIINEHPNIPELHISRGLIFYTDGKFDKAFEDIKISIMLNPLAGKLLIPRINDEKISKKLKDLMDIIIDILTDSI